MSREEYHEFLFAKPGTVQLLEYSESDAKSLSVGNVVPILGAIWPYPNAFGYSVVQKNRVTGEAQQSPNGTWQVPTVRL